MSPDPTPQLQNAKIERAKALLAAKSIVSRSDYAKIRSIVDPHSELELDRALEGLSQEDEFALMCRLMETTTHLVPLGQRPVIKGDFIVSDFLARFQPGCTPDKKTPADSKGFRAFVEVKSTREMTYKIGGAALRKRRAFSDEFGFPLLFAVRFLKFDSDALWVIVEDHDRSQSSVKATVADLTDGVGHVLWDDYLMMVWPDIQLRVIFDVAPPKGIVGVTHPTYGAMREYHIVLPQERTICGQHVVNNAARYVDHNAIVMSAFFEGFRPVEIAAHRNGTMTTQLLRPTLPCSLANMVYSINRLARDEHGNVLLDPSRVLAGSDSDLSLFTRTFVEKVAADLWGSVIAMLTFGEEKHQISHWMRFGGR